MIAAYDKKINRKVRVFISSTFSDMGRERDVLVHSVFPRLRKEFSNRMIDIMEVDLRWGIPEEDSEDSQILEICIGEVLHCSPFFVGIIGRRYGSVASSDAVEGLPPAYREALGKNVPDNTSITELEMRAGVFVPNNVDFSCFFIRADAVNCPDESSRVTDLIHTIEDHYSTQVYQDIQDFEAEIYTSIREYILRVLPGEMETPYQDPYYFSHLKTLKNKAFRYTENQMFINGAERRIGESGKIYLHGEKGSGKSAAMARLIQREGVERDRKVFFHFAAAGNDSLKTENAFFRLKRFLESELGQVSSERGSREAVLDLIQKIPVDERITLYFDAMDQMDDVTAVHQFLSIADLHPGIRVICSGTESYQQIGSEHVIEMEKLTRDQIRQIIHESLKRYGKKLNVSMRARIMEKESCTNPLFLKALISQLRMYGSYETLDAFLDRLIRAESLSDIFTITEERLKAYFQDRGSDPKLVEQALALIVFSNNGILETELQDILQMMPVARSVLFSAIELFVIEDNGLIRLNHDLIVRTVRAHLTKNQPDIERTTAEKLTEYFDAQPAGWRKFSEYAYQIRKLNDTEKLLQALSDPDWFLYLAQHEHASLIGYLSALVDRQKELTAALCKTDLQDDHLRIIAETLCQGGCYHAAISLTQAGLKSVTDPDIRIRMMDTQARSYYKLGSNRFQDSIRAYHELIAYYEKIHPRDEVGYAARAYLLGVAYKTSGDMATSQKMIRECAEIHEKHHVMNATSLWTLDVYSETLFQNGKLQEGMRLLDQILNRCARLFGKNSAEMAWAYCYGWDKLYAAGEKNRALDMVRSAYEIYSRMYFGRGTRVAWAAGNAGIAAMIDGNEEKAEELYRFSIRENDIILPEEQRPHVYSLTTYGNYAILCEIYRKHGQAMELIEKALKESTEKNGENHIYTVNFILEKGIILKNANLVKQALERYQNQNVRTPDIWFTRVCLIRILSLEKRTDEALKELAEMENEYFAQMPETGLITYLLLETIDKLKGDLSEERMEQFEDLYRFEDYRFYLTHNNNSQMILIPRI